MADTFHLKITSPDRIFFEGEVTMVEINTTEGQIGVLPNHIPLTSVLAPGVCYIYVPGQDPKVCAIHGGFFEILQDSMTILAEVCEWPEEIDLARAEEAKVRAERFLYEKPAGTDIARATLALKRSAARIEAAKK
jgi:F-type H+-transporting ATPase subunit epsilon